jgi:hypothetical protein
MTLLQRASALATHAPRTLASAAAVLALTSGCLATSASATTATFTPGGTGEFVVPTGVTHLEVTAIGGAGEAGGECLDDGYPAGGAGGSGAKVTATLPVTGLKALYVHFGGGGAAGASPGGCIPPGGAGGGASDVRSEEASPASRLIVAGGGGGGGSGDAAFEPEEGLFGGAGGSANAAAGGNGGEGGDEEFGFTFPLTSGGEGASTSEAGKGGAARGSCVGNDGSIGEGGAGTAGSNCGGAGGGGAGYFGGGAGAGDNNGGGGGGAGSSYTAPGASGAEITSGAGEPQQVLITYTIPPAPTALIASPASGRSYLQGELVKTDFACSDGEGGPGVESCLDSNGGSGVSGQLDTTSLGAHTYTVTARSSDGLSGSASIAFTVVAPTTEAARTSASPQAPASPAPPPSPEACVSRRTLVIHPALHLHLPHGNRIISAKALLRGRAVAEARGSSHPALDLSLAGLPKGTYPVTLLVHTSRGKPRTLVLLLHTCGTSAL